MLHDVLATGHRRRWLPDANVHCPFGCPVTETAVHLFLDCPVAETAWSVTLTKWQGICNERWKLSPWIVATGRPIDFDADGHFDLRLLGRWDRMHAATVQAIW